MMSPTIDRQHRSAFQADSSTALPGPILVARSLESPGADLPLGEAGRAAERHLSPAMGWPAEDTEGGRARRRAPASDDPLSRLRVRAGADLVVIDVSNTGALVESSVRPLPGTDIDVRITTDGASRIVRSHVVRAYISHMEANLVRYRLAIAFDRAIDTSVAGNVVHGRAPETAVPGASSGATLAGASHAEQRVAA